MHGGIYRCTGIYFFKSAFPIVFHVFYMRGDIFKYTLVHKSNLVYLKLVDCLEKCLIYGHIRRVAD